MPNDVRDFLGSESVRALPQAKRRRGHIFLLLLITLLLAYPFLPWQRWLNRDRQITVPNTSPPKPEIQYVERVVYEKPPLPDKSVASANIPPDVAKLYNGLMVSSELKKMEGGRAAVERLADSAYNIEFKINLRVPTPNQSLEDLSSINPHLARALPHLEAMLASAKVSNFYHHLYDLKIRRLQTNLTRLKEIPSKHNLYDCETILELQDPETKQLALLIQGEMDVVTDGSDGDRSPEYDEFIAKSQFYQPFTSYGWAKTGSQPNPLLPRWEQKLEAAEKEARDKSTAALQSRIKTLKREIADLQSRSYLIARHDPFIVIPVSFLGYQDKTPYGPKIGDYAVVFHENHAYPAIIGDGGPSYKMGEASLRIAKAINSKSGPNSRPVSDLSVSYLIFPQSADPPAPPDLALWHKRCLELLNKLGGLGQGYSLHEWEDTLKKAAETPAPPAPSPSPEAKSTPG